MYFRNSKSRKKWQKTFIDNVFSHKTATINTFSRILLYNTYLLEDKNSHLPKSLFKFYSPTAENIMDVKKQRLRLSHPKTFNDPFDCHTGYDTKSYVSHALLKYIEKTGYIIDVKNSPNGFTHDEFDRLKLTTYGYNWYGKEEYDSVLWKLLESKSEDFKRIINGLKAKYLNEVKTKIEKLRDVNIRVACFSALDRLKNFNDIIQIWSHYADNHKGFCIEYDISSLKESSFSLKEHDFYKNQSKYMDERVKLLIIGGLFPVIYTANRVNIPKTKLNKIKLDEIGNPFHDSYIDSILYKTFIVKSAKWSYEKEWRLILDGDVCNYYDNKIPFPYITRIFLGCKMNTQTIDTMIEIAEELGVKVLMMEMDNKRFMLEERSTWLYKYDKESAKLHSHLF